MKQEKVIISSIAITQPGEIKHFQVKIPRDAKSIIGIEANASKVSSTSPGGGVIGMPPIGGIGHGGGAGGGGGLPGPIGGGGGPTPPPFSLLFNQDYFLGSYRLQSCGDANIFFAGSLFLGDNNVGEGDFSAIYLLPKEYIQFSKHYEEKANEEGSATLFKGIYRDGQPPGGAFNLYTVKIYTWYELNCKKA